MATAAMQNLIQEPHANVHACVRHNIISSFESMILFFFFYMVSSLFQTLDGNTILESCNLKALRKSFEYADSRVNFHGILRNP